MSRLTNWILLIAQAGAQGNVCSNVNYATTPSRNMLRGKHVVVSTTEWSPFSIRDNAAPRGWRGIDFEVLERFSSLLGFNYSVVEFSNEGDAGWNDDLARMMAGNTSDVSLTYWARNSQRLDAYNMLEGHIDMSEVLAVRMSVAESTSFYQQCTSFFRPLSWTLWGCIVLLVIFSGVVDHILERRSGPGVHIGGNIWEFVAGTLWGGFEQPRTSASAVYQVVVAFIILVTVSACACPPS